MTKIGTTEWDALIEVYDLDTDTWTTSDLAFYLAEAQQHSPVLELACGTGRLTIPIAKAGVPIIGLDASSKMLACAREKSGNLHNLEFVLGRMEQFNFEQKFGLIFICFSSFTCLKTIEAQKKTLLNIHKHLKKGGRLIVDLFTPNEEQIGKPLSNEQKNEWTFARELQDPNDGQRHQLWERVQHIPNEQLFELESMIKILDSKGNVVGETEYFKMLGRYLHRYELQYLLSLCGFEIVNLYGWFNREPFNNTSKRMIWIATPS